MNRRKYDGKKSCCILVGISAVIGMLVFMFVFGVNILDISNDEWLLQGGDISQHYFGWLYYRKSDWKFPIGMISDMIDLDVSVIFMDSIPILALIFKLLSPILPATFQYFGIWGIVSYGLMGALAAAVLYQYIDSKVYCCIGSVFFIFSPIMLQRMYTHTSLGAQWIIILAILIWNCQPAKLRYKVLMWTGIACLGAMTHLYFVPFTFGFIFFDAVKVGVCEKGIKKINAVAILLVPLIMALTVLFCMGAFSGTGEYQVWGWGFYSANINALINPMNASLLLPDLACGEGQYEGFAYLGLGIWFLVGVDAVLCIRNWTTVKEMFQEKKVTISLLLLLAIIFAGLSLSPIIMMGEEVIYSFQWPDIIAKILGIFRASGRFMWIPVYLIFVFSIIFCYKHCSKRSALIIIIIACVIQIIDLSPLIITKKNVSVQMGEYERKIDEEKWNLLLKDKEKIVFVPHDTVYINQDITYAIGNMAYDNEIALNSFYVSRPDAEKMTSLTNSYIEQIPRGEADKYVFVFYDESHLLDDSYNLNYYYVDGVYVGVTIKIETLEAIN